MAPRRKVTPNDIEQIVRMRLTEGASYREIGARLNLNKDTVHKHWHEWCAEQAPATADALEELLNDHLAHLSRAHRDALDLYRRAVGLDDADVGIGLADRALNTRLRILKEIGTLRGLDQPTKLELSGSLGISVDTLSDEELDKLANGD